MKRDMDLIRDILIPTGSSEDFIDVETLYEELEKKGNSKEIIDYHLVLLHEAGYIDGLVLHPVIGAAPSIQVVSPLRLTWEGHEFADSARDDKIWNQAKKTIAEKSGTATFEVMKALLISIAKSTFGL